MNPPAGVAARALLLAALGAGLGVAVRRRRRAAPVPAPNGRLRDLGPEVTKVEPIRVQVSKALYTQNHADQLREVHLWVQQELGLPLQELKWTDEDFAAATNGQLPLGKHTDEWVVGDVEAG